MRKLLVALVTLVALTGCSDDTTASDAPDASPSSTPAAAPTSADEDEDADAGTDGPVAEPPCDVISDEQVTEWAGSPQSVNGPQQVGALEQCGTVTNPGDSLSLVWSFTEPAPLPDVVEQENLDGRLDEEDIELAGGTPAVLLTGDIVGETSAAVVTVVDDRALVVTARDNGIGDEPRRLTDLRTIATEVAEAYAA